MKAWNIDVSVLLIFFVRDDTFKQVFESVKKVRPRRLLLWQDGPRRGREDDKVGIQKCREIAAGIDWECEVYRHYNEENLGCDPSTFYADKWAFSIVDKCIILEDDQVPSQSYFRFCKELLDKYENDARISHICGNNTFNEVSWCDSDYLFAHTGTGAWASWRRVAQNWDEQYAFLDNTKDIKNLKAHYGQRSKMWVEYSQRHKKSGIAHWESIIGMGAHLQSQYVIIPKKNLVQNIGIGKNATHSSVSDLKYLPKRDRAFYINEAQEIEFPLKHPTAVLPDEKYDEKRTKENNPNIFQKLGRKVAFACNLIRYGQFKLLFKTLLKK